MLHAVGAGPHGQVGIAAGHDQAGREYSHRERKERERDTFWLALSAAAQAPDVDLWFIDNMTAHHQGAVHMAEDALKKAKHPELKTFARQIIRTEWERA